MVGVIRHHQPINFMSTSYSSYFHLHIGMKPWFFPPSAINNDIFQGSGSEHQNYLNMNSIVTVNVNFSKNGFFRFQFPYFLE